MGQKELKDLPLSLVDLFYREYLVPQFICEITTNLPTATRFRLHNLLCEWCDSGVTHTLYRACIVHCFDAVLLRSSSASTHACDDAVLLRFSPGSKQYCFVTATEKGIYWFEAVLLRSSKGKTVRPGSKQCCTEAALLRSTA